MSEPYYIAAVYATRVIDDLRYTGVSVGLVHPIDGGDENHLGLICAKATFPAEYGWEDHYATLKPLEALLVDTIIVERGIGPPTEGLVMTTVGFSRIEPDIEDEP